MKTTELLVTWIIPTLSVLFFLLLGIGIVFVWLRSFMHFGNHEDKPKPIREKPDYLTDEDRRRWKQLIDASKESKR